MAAAYLFLVRRMQRSRFSLRSPVAQEIADHLTPFERDSFAANARDYSRRLGKLLGLLVIPSVLAGFYSLWLGALFAVFAAFAIVPLMRAEFRRMRHLLTATEWARSRGIVPGNLRLFSFPGFR